MRNPISKLGSRSGFTSLLRLHAEGASSGLRPELNLFYFSLPMEKLHFEGGGLGCMCQLVRSELFIWKRLKMARSAGEGTNTKQALSYNMKIFMIFYFIVTENKNNLILWRFEDHLKIWSVFIYLHLSLVSKRVCLRCFEENLPWLKQRAALASIHWGGGFRQKFGLNEWKKKMEKKGKSKVPYRKVLVICDAMFNDDFFG